MVSELLELIQRESAPEAHQPLAENHEHGRTQMEFEFHVATSYKN